MSKSKLTLKFHTSCIKTAVKKACQWSVQLQRSPRPLNIIFLSGGYLLAVIYYNDILSFPSALAAMTVAHQKEMLTSLSLLGLLLKFGIVAETSCCLTLKQSCSKQRNILLTLLKVKKIVGKFGSTGRFVFLPLCNDCCTNAHEVRIWWFIKTMLLALLINIIMFWEFGSTHRQYPSFL